MSLVVSNCQHFRYGREKGLEALRRKEAKQEGQDTHPEVLLDQIRCMEEVVEWSQLLSLFSV